MSLYYERSGIQIWHGDCRDILPALTADALVTDPPYGIGWSRATWDDRPEDYPELMRWLVAEAQRGVSGLCFVFQAMLNAGHYHEWFPAGWRIFAACKNFSQVQNTAVWSSWDPVVFWNNGPNNGPNSGPNSQIVNRDYHVGNVAGLLRVKARHPSPRPLDTMRHIVALAAAEGQTIIDPFMGSGTTLVAAQSLGRRAVGIEISEEYCRIAVNRLQQMPLPLQNPVSQDVLALHV